CQCDYRAAGPARESALWSVELRLLEGNRRCTMKYPLKWRILHSIIAILVLTLVPVGIWMAQRAGNDVFGTLTDTLYSMHKAIGFTVLLLMVVRVIVRSTHQVPPYP